MNLQCSPSHKALVGRAPEVAWVLGRGSGLRLSSEQVNLDLLGVQNGQHGGRETVCSFLTVGHSLMPGSVLNTSVEDLRKVRSFLRLIAFFEDRPSNTQPIQSLLLSVALTFFQLSDGIYIPSPLT